MTIENDGVGRLRRALDLRDQDEGGAPARGTAERAYEPPAAVDELAQRHLLAFFFHAPAPAPVPDNDDTLALAMTDGARDEVAALALHGRGHLTAVLGSPTTRVDAADGSGAKIDVSSREGIDAFVKTLGVPADVANNVATAIYAADLAGRDELAGVAKAWAPAERGGSAPSRLLLSGHGTNGRVYDLHCGDVRFEDIARLARAMPSAAAHVEDVFVAACYQGDSNRLQVFVDAFPNLRTAHGYEDVAPARDVANVLAWEVATRGRVERRLALPQGNSWTAHGGFSSSRLTLDVARAEARRLDVFERYFQGEARDASPASGPLSDYYAALHRLAARVPEDEKPALAKRVETTVLLRHYPAVARCIARDHAAALRAGFRALDASPPDFGRLDRKQALLAIADAERRARALASPPPETVEALRLLRALRDLENDPTKRLLRFE